MEAKMKGLFHFKIGEQNCGRIKRILIKSGYMGKGS